MWLSTVSPIVIMCLLRYSNAICGVEMQVSPARLREGDSYNVSCWIVDLAEVQAKCNTTKLGMRYSQPLETRRLNDSAIYYEVAAAQSQPKDDLHCYICTCNNKWLSSITFQIGVRQLNISDPVCRFVDDSASPLICEFKVPSRVFEVNPLTYFVIEYEKEGAYERRFNCSRLVNTLRCNVTMFGSFFQKHDFVVSMYDGLGVLKHNFSLTRLDSIVLPPTGEDLKELSSRRNSTAFCLQSTDMQQSKYINDVIEYQVQLRHKSRDLDIKWMPENSTANGKNITIYCVSPLLPHNNYKLNVRRRLKGGIHWSDEFVYNITTKATIPARPPVVWSNGYAVDSDRSTLFVYWQQLANSEYAGDNFTYNVIVRNNQDHGQIVNASIEVESNMATIRNLPTGNDVYDITIRSQNHVGMSQNSSIIKITQLANVQDRQAFNLCVDRNLGKLRWNQPTLTTDLNSYTVFWCESTKLFSNRCLKDLEATNTQSLSNEFNLAKFVNDSFGYRWGVATNYSVGDGSVVWWNTGDWCVDSKFWDTFEGIIALSVLGFISYLLIRKWRYMSNIKVDLPAGILIDQASNRILHSQHDDLAPLVVYSATVRPLHSADNSTSIVNSASNAGSSNTVNSMENIDNDCVVAATGYTELSPMLRMAPEDKSIQSSSEPAVVGYISMGLPPMHQLSNYVSPPATYS